MDKAEKLSNPKIYYPSRAVQSIFYDESLNTLWNNLHHVTKGAQLFVYDVLFVTKFLYKNYMNNILQQLYIPFILCITLTTLTTFIWTIKAVLFFIAN
jgi:hypothetical protein